MSNLVEVLPLVQALPAEEKQELFQILAVELKADAEASEPFVYDPSNPMLGLLHDDPELADEIVRMAMHDRETRPWRTTDE